jgi:hypothetical protein
MRNRQNTILWALKWPALAAALVAGAFALLPAFQAATPVPPAEPVVEVVSRAEMRDAMRILRDGHDKVLDQVDRQRAESEQKAAEEAHAFERAREEARLAAEREAARKLAEQKLAEQRAAEQRAAEARAPEAKRVAEVTPAKPLPKPKPEPAAAGAPLDIVPAAGEPPVVKPRGPIETVVATVGGVADDIKNKTVSTVVGIKDWFSAAGDKLLGRDKPASSGPTSRLSSTY